MTARPAHSEWVARAEETLFYDQICDVSIENRVKTFLKFNLISFGFDDTSTEAKEGNYLLHHHKTDLLSPESPLIWNQTMSNQQQAVTQRSLTGFVTKLVGGTDGSTYGFINDEIFFPQANVSGGPAAVGDQVFAECEYSAHLPIKWNAKSVQVLSKGAGGVQPRSDQQEMMNQSAAQQQQQPQQHINMANPVAVTYQQHRQQRQQRQVMDVNKQPDKQQNNDLTSKLLEQTAQSGEYFANNARLFPQQQQDNNIQPFQDTPMGPPNFTYTSQLGSAFVQNQFVPSPFMTQQQPPLLPQQQILPNNNQQMHSNNNNNQNNRSNQHNKGGRFNNQGDKNDRQNNRRNRNDNKFDRPRSGDREGGQQNNRSKSSGSRDRSIGRNSKRDDQLARPSPPAHSSARSNNSISSDRSKNRKHYEIQNIPKTQIMTNMNAYNMKQRCPSSVHVPSDLKEIIVNRHFRLDVKNTPKPLNYTIEQTKSETASVKDEVDKEKIENESTNEEVAKNQDVPEVTQKDEEGDQQEQKPEIIDAPVMETDSKKEDIKAELQPAQSTVKPETKLSHKYGVKVILISMPELSSIYRTVFGSNLDSFNNDTKPNSRLDETISLLCNKGTNNGYSLIGGKFDPIADGFVEGQMNDFERHGLQPDLIATCKRVVLEQTGLDLSGCKSWTLLSTFIYNNKSDYFSSKASIEYSFIYMPQIWTMFSDKFDKTILKQESSEIENADQTIPDSAHSIEQIPMETEQTLNAQSTETDNNDVNQSVESNAPDSVEPTTENPVSIPENLSELKVTDLKMELDKRNIKYKGGAKKAELIALLQESLPHDIEHDVTRVDVEVQLEDVKKLEEVTKLDSLNKREADEEDANISTVATIGDESQLEEGEVEADPSEDSPILDGEDNRENSESGGKRKAYDDVETGINEPDAKKVCKVGSEKKDKKVELIQESFIVRSRGDQQLSLVSLYEATQAARYDQFELSVASNLLKESLVQHLSEYIITTLVDDNLHRHAGTTTTTMSTGTGGTSSSSSSQEIGSDTNNNSSGAVTSKSTFKNPSSITDQKVNLKELPVDRYINLALSYFDSSHMGHIHTDDLNKLFNNTGLTISKRALLSLVGDSDRFNYRTLPDLSPKLSPTYVYRFPSQFSCLPGSSINPCDDSGSLKTIGKLIEYKGVTYDVEKLIQQVNDAETSRVSLVDRFNYAIENFDKQAEEIHVLEVSQKSLAKAIKAQNDEICDLKRERDSIKKKVSNIDVWTAGYCHASILL